MLVGRRRMWASPKREFKRAEVGGRGRNTARWGAFAHEQPFGRVRAWQRRFGADDTGWKNSSVVRHARIPGWRPDQHKDPVAPSHYGTTPSLNVTRKIALTPKKSSTEPRP